MDCRPLRCEGYRILRHLKTLQTPKTKSHKTTETRENLQGKLKTRGYGRPLLDTFMRLMRHSVHCGGCSKCRIHWLNRIGANKARECRTRLGRAATSSWDHPSSCDWWKHLLLQAEYVVPAFQYPNWQTGSVFLHMIENIWKAMSVNCGISVNWMNSGGLKRPFSGEVYQPEQPSQTKSKSSIVGHMHPKKDSTEREVFQKMHQKNAVSYSENPRKRGHAHAWSIGKLGWLPNATLDLEYCLQCAPVSIDQLWPEYPNPGVYGHFAHDVVRCSGLASDRNKKQKIMSILPTTVQHDMFACLSVHVQFVQFSRLQPRCRVKATARHL